MTSAAAVGTSTVPGFLIGVPGTIGYIITGWGVPGLPPFSPGYANLLAAAVVIPLTMVFSQLGARLAHTIPRRALRMCFGIFLLFTSLRMFIDLFGG